MRPDPEEVLRRLGMQDAPQEARREALCAAEALGALPEPKWCWRILPLSREDGLRLGSVRLPGESAARMLRTCAAAAVLCCTLGFAFETRLRTEQAREMSRAVILDACGSALVEAGCDAAQREIAASCPGRFLTDRFSPGYGDLPLDLQTELCRLLDAERRLGVCVNDAMLLNPTKTVTALIGLSDEMQAARIRGCAFCALAGSCTFRKKGTTCEH